MSISIKLLKSAYGRVRSRECPKLTEDKWRTHTITLTSYKAVMIKILIAVGWYKDSKG